MALATVDDPTKAKQALQRLTTTKKDAAGRSCPGFNPMAQLDADLFKSLMDGEHSLRGFTNRDIRSQLTKTRWLRSCADDSVEGQCEGGPLLQAATCTWADSQDSANAPLARHGLRQPGDGHVAVSARAPLPKRLRHRSNGLIFLAKDKELTAKESILLSLPRCSIEPLAPHVAVVMETIVHCNRPAASGFHSRLHRTPARRCTPTEKH